MAASFDINRFKSLPASTPVRYQKRLAELQDKGMETVCIEAAVDGAISNITDHTARSFVIYGEPQSGKTEMMIALTARLLDAGHKIIIILLNDSVQLLDQNLERFLLSGLDPAPKKFDEILDPNVHLAGSNWVIFCKKNAADLNKLINKLGKTGQKVVIDDEADYATPNGKVNLAEKTKINELVGDLLSDTGIYIGVTATPARLDVNNTFDNDNRRWIDFPPHHLYTGQDVFFPTTASGLSLDFNLELMPSTGDQPKYLRAALFSFLVNVAFLNLKVNPTPINYSMLIHTSGKKADHAKDYEQVVAILSILRDENSSKYESYVESIFNRANKLYPDSEDDITRYIIEHIGQSDVIVMNSNAPKNATTYKRATSPAAVFTIAIGGNIVSRGVTFDNLLSMFFTRDVKHKLQQDTYIQRARMFGSRGRYLKYFELHIPDHLYFDWQKCFVFHRLALSSIRAGMGIPIWVEGSRVQLTSPSSIDRARVVLDSGEMSWELFDYSDSIDQCVESNGPALTTLQHLASLVGTGALPGHVIEFVKNFIPWGDSSVAVHRSTLLSASYASADVDNISRAKGFMAQNTLEAALYPKAIHHFKIFRNPSGKARVFYKYAPGADKVRFMKKPS